MVPLSSLLSSFLSANLALPSVYTGIAIIAFSFLAISAFLLPKKMNKFNTN
jgi:hypothetical protein